MIRYTSEDMVWEQLPVQVYTTAMCSYRQYVLYYSCVYCTGNRIYHIYTYMLFTNTVIVLCVYE